MVKTIAKDFKLVKYFEFYKYFLSNRISVRIMCNCRLHYSVIKITPTDSICYCFFQLFLLQTIFTNILMVSIV